MAENNTPFQKFGKTWTVRAITAHDLNVDPTGNLKSFSKKYGVSAQEIVSANDVRFTNATINEWVLSTTGGRMLSSGFAVFAPGGRIFLPTVAVIPEPGQPGGAIAPRPPQAAQVSLLGVPWWGWAGVGAVGVFAFMKRKKKGKQS